MLKLMMRSALAGCALAVGACAAPIRPLPPLPSVAAFQVADHAEYIDPGAGSVRGQAFLRQRGGGIVTCAGSVVYAHPATPFFRQLLAHNRAGGTSTMVPGANAALSLVRQTRCDAQGNFEFRDLPVGAWLITTSVRWSVRDSEQGGDLLKVAAVQAADEPALLLSDGDLYSRNRLHQ